VGAAAGVALNYLDWGRLSRYKKPASKGPLLTPFGWLSLPRLCWLLWRPCCSVKRAR